MVRIKMIIQYDGTNYHGFQKQLNAHTIQEEIEHCLNKLTGENISVIGAGRTDAGVHARGQVIAFDTDSTIPPERFDRALNSILPADIRVLKSQLTRADFNPRFDAIGKQYHYLIYRIREQALFFRNYACLCSRELNVEAMQRACSFITGKHDFKGFSSTGSSAKTSIRTVSSCFLEDKGAFLVLNIAADGFLYNMVRIIAGTLLEIGRGRLAYDIIPAIFETGERSLAGPTAPPQGLYLVAVTYRE
ncbi:MAG: tRNA pseudouridine(38-40) synthase TruA [Syntrophomonadaceae bacterium]